MTCLIAPYTGLLQRKVTLTDVMGKRDYDRLVMMFADEIISLQALERKVELHKRRWAFKKEGE